ncbi:hypothetical protein ACFWFU_27150 [Streptomyces sp. NPDC060235]|uniref:hypothetical protein n=1 Tax=unclassified Streptomyces TaxID=2593676 RepID=UPI00365102A8
MVWFEVGQGEAGGFGAGATCAVSTSMPQKNVGGGLELGVCADQLDPMGSDGRTPVGLG